MKKTKLICSILAFTTILAVGCSTNKDKSNVTANINNSATVDQNQKNKQDDKTKTEISSQIEKNTDKKDDANAKVKTSSSEKKTDDQASVQTSTSTSNVTLGLFIPNGSYEVKYSGSDLADSIQYIKGNGSTYETIGTNGKGPFVKVYTADTDGIYGSYSGDLTTEEMKNVATVDYLGKENNLNKDYVLEGPVQVGTRWGNKEIVEVGQDLKLGDLSLKGTYVKTWEREDGKEGDLVKVHYYSEGLGCVDYRAMSGDKVVESSTLISYEKK